MGRHAFIEKMWVQSSLDIKLFNILSWHSKNRPRNPKYSRIRRKKLVGTFYNVKHFISVYTYYLKKEKEIESCGTVGFD